MSNDDFLHSCIYRKVYFARKISFSVSKNPINSQILGNKINIFTGRQSKTKNRSCFLPARFDLELTSFLEICVHKKLWRSVLSNMRDTKNARFDAKVEGAHSRGIILNVPAKVNFTKLCTGKSVLFE